MGYLDLSKQELEKEYGNLVKRFEESAESFLRIFSV